MAFYVGGGKGEEKDRAGCPVYSLAFLSRAFPLSIRNAEFFRYLSSVLMKECSSFGLAIFPLLIIRETGTFDKGSIVGLYEKLCCKSMSNVIYLCRGDKHAKISSAKHEDRAGSKG